jgi:3,2-trans-enoyl-CoA isomerase
MMMQQQQQQGGAPPQGEDAEDQQPPPPPTKPDTMNFVTVDVTAAGVATIAMSRAPVNSLNLDFFEELNQWLMWLSYDDACKSVILTSALSMVFSAGLDITELQNPQPERFEKFWTAFQEVWMILNSYPKPIVAAINGNAPAAGCILAMCADFRIMAKAPAAHPEKLYRIGLNETKLGLIAPPWVMNQLTYIVGSRKAEKMLQLGETPTADEALAMGLVDQVVAEADVLTAAAKCAEGLSKVSNEARWMSKDMMRRDLMQFFANEEERRYDTNFFAQLLTNPEVQDNIGKYLARLGKK